MSMRSNCLVFAMLLWFRRRKYWSDPVRRHRAPRRYICIRKADDCDYPHFLYEERGHKVSFKPFDVATGPLPSIWFKGYVCWGDKPAGSVSTTKDGRERTVYLNVA